MNNMDICSITWSVGQIIGAVIALAFCLYVILIVIGLVITYWKAQDGLDD